MILKWVLIFLFSFATPSLATNYYVLDGGTSETCTSWTDACDEITTAETLVGRDDVIYVGDGNYTGVTFDTASDGTKTITITRCKAGAAGFAACSAAAGYSASDHDGVATFTSRIAFNSAYWVLDGVTGGGPSAWTTGFGFRQKINNSTYDSYLVFGANGNNITIRHIDIGPDEQPNPGCDCAVYSVNGADNNTFQYNYFHDMGDVGFTIIDSSGWLLDSNRMNKIDRYGEKDGICGTLGQLNHGTGIELYDTAGIVIKNNYITNVEGTGWIGFYGEGVLDSLYLFNNVFQNVEGFEGSWGNGIVYNTSGAGYIKS